MSCKHCEPLLNPFEDEAQPAFSAYESGDYGKARELLLPLAQRGSVVAQCLIGSMYQLGLGTTMNASKAVDWYLKAGQQGCGLAYNNLASMFEGAYPELEVDPDKVREFRVRAAENGFTMFPANPDS